MKRTQVREVMTTTMVTASEATPYRHLAGLLYAKGIGACPSPAPGAGCRASA